MARRTADGGAAIEGMHLLRDRQLVEIGARVGNGPIPSWMSPVSSAFSSQSGVPMSRPSSTSFARAKKRRMASATGNSGFIALAVDEPHPELAGQRPPQLAEARLAVLDAGEHLLGPRVDRRALVGQGEAGPAAATEREAERHLEVLDVGADSGLAHPDHRLRAEEAAVLGDGAEGAQVAQGEVADPHGARGYIGNADVDIANFGLTSGNDAGIKGDLRDPLACPGRDRLPSPPLGSGAGSVRPPLRRGDHPR